VGKAPSFEVVVAAYGESSYLQQTLESVVANVAPNVHITVLDDASPTDAIALIAATVAPRVRYVRNRDNRGTSGSFNEAMHLSQSDYTVLVGPDDLLLAGAGSFYTEVIQRANGAAVIHPGVVIIDEMGNAGVPLPDRVKAAIRPRSGTHSGQGLARGLLLGNWTYNPAMAWRTDLVDTIPFDETLATAMDLDRLLRLALAGESLVLRDDPVFAYRRHSGAVSSVNRGRQRLQEELVIHARIRPLLRARRWYQAAAAATVAPTARLHGLQVSAAPGSTSLRDRRATVGLALAPLGSTRLR
jgi:glycosyltransferase involved in cell wall biosynthesis